MAQVIQRHVRRRVVIKKALIQRTAFRQHNGVALRGIRVRQHGIPRLNAELRQCFFRVSRLKENAACHLVVLLVNRLIVDHIARLHDADDAQQHCKERIQPLMKRIRFVTHEHPVRNRKDDAHQRAVLVDRHHQDDRAGKPNLRQKAVQAIRNLQDAVRQGNHQNQLNGRVKRGKAGYHGGIAENQHSKNRNKQPLGVDFDASQQLGEHRDEKQDVNQQIDCCEEAHVKQSVVRHQFIDDDRRAHQYPLN